MYQSSQLDLWPQDALEWFVIIKAVPYGSRRALAASARRESWLSSLPCGQRRRELLRNVVKRVRYI